MDIKFTGWIVAGLLLCAPAVEQAASEEDLPFYFQDRPGKLPLSTPAAIEIPEGGFSDAGQLQQWLTGTTWTGGAQNNLTLIFHAGGQANFTWSTKSRWSTSGIKKCRLTHEKSHWTVDLLFSDDYKTLELKNGKRSNGSSFSWGQMRLTGRK